MRLFFCNIVCFFILSESFLFAQIQSPFNDKLVEVDSTGSYRFIVSGHFYGDGTNKSGYPANTLLGNLDWINHDSNADMLICLGDLFMDIRNDMPKYEHSFFSKLQIPLYNAVGNHDISANVYQENYGATYFSFEINNDIHIILDTEKDNGDIENEQLDILNNVLQRVKEKNVNNVFIYAHRTIWKSSYEQTKDLFPDNTQSLTANNFESYVLPIISQISEKANVYWFAGSLGDAPASFFYFKDEKNQITYIATAIRALLRDAVLIVDVDQNGGVKFTTHSFTFQELKKLEEYNVDFWKTEKPQEPFNYKLIPLYIKNTLLSRYFWYGTLFAFCIFGTMVWFIRRRRLKRNK